MYNKDNNISENITKRLEDSNSFISYKFNYYKLNYFFFNLLIMNLKYFLLLLLL